MKITVTELRLLQNAVRDRLRDLLFERKQIAFIEFEKDEEYTPYERTVEAVVADIQKVQEHYRTVKFALTRSNINTVIQWNGKEISIHEAIELVKQMRNEVNELTYLGSSREMERYTRGTSVFYKKALFDPPNVKKDAQKLLKEANGLSIAIDKANFNTYVEVDFVDEYQ